MLQAQHYYRHLDRASQAAYTAMLTGFTSLARSIRVLKLPIDQLSHIFFQVRLDNPMVFYVTGFTCRSVREADYTELIPDYLFEKGKIQSHQKALQARITKLIRPAQGLSDLEKEEYIHSFLCENVQYDKLKKPYAHEILGPLAHGVGVCEGIAKTVKLFCDHLDIPCMVAISDADPEHGVKYRHAWNILQLNGQWYHLDATFDNSLGRYGALRHDYFNLDDRQIFRDHRPLLYPAPSCSDGSHFYYKVNHLSWTKVEDVEKRVLQAIRKKKSPLVFHWRGGCLTRTVLLQLAEAIDAAARSKGKFARISVNYPQAVLQVTLSDEDASSSIEAECADEGESTAAGAFAPQEG